MIKEHDDVAVFLGMDVGKGEHYAVALDRSGRRLLDRALPNDETRLRELYRRLGQHGPLLLVVDQPVGIVHARPPVTGAGLSSAALVLAHFP